MEYSTLSNGMRLPQLGLGMWEAKGEEAYQSVKDALQVGYRHIDTAMYYFNEEEVGKAIKDSGIPREELTIATKIWYTDMKPEQVRETFEQSLKNLQLDYVDLYLLHWPLNDYIGSWAVLEELYQEGKIKAIGVSNFQKHHLEALFQTTKIRPMLNQIEIHPTFSQTSLVEYCHEQEIAVQAWAPFGKGVDLNHKAIVELSEKYHKTTAQIILRWHLQKGILVIPKTVKKPRMVENIEVFDFALSEDDLIIMDGLDTGKTERAYPSEYEWN